MEDKKSYYVQIPGTQQGQTWDEDKYNRNADKLREKYPDAVVMETSPYTDGDFADDDLFRVQIPGTAQGQTWDGAKFRRNREALMSKYPDVSISRFSPISGAVQSELNFNDEPQGRASEPDEAYWNQHRTALDNINRQISEKLAGQKELDEEMERIYSQEAAELGYAPAISQRHRDAQESYKTSLNDLYCQRHDNPAYQQEVSTSRTAISTASKSVQDRIDKLTADNAEDYANFAASERPEAGPAPSSGYYKQNNPKFEGDYRLLRAAKAFYSDADKTITAPSRYDDSHWIGNLVEGITDNPQKLISLLDLHDQYIKQPLMTVVNKIQKKEGEHVNLIEYIQSENAQKDLSENEREVIKALIAKTAAETLRAGDISLAYQSGETIAGSVGFMLDFILTNKIGSAAGKAATNWMTRGLAKAVNNAGINYTERVAAEAVPKFLIGTVESAAKTAATTPFMPSSYANFANQMMQMNEAGQVDLSGKALANKFFDVLIENFSEYAGLQVEGILGAPIKAFRKGAGWAFDKIGWEKWGDMISHYRAPKILKQAAFNGYLGEYGEEWYGNAIRVMTGVDKDALKNFSTVEQQIVTLSSFAPMSLFGAGSSIAQQRRAVKKLENAAETLQNVLKENGYDEKTISNILDVTKAENPSDLARQLAPVVNQVANDNGRAGDVYKAVCDYAYAVAKYRTFDGIKDADITAEREQMAGEITQALGNENWIHTKPVTINKKDGTTDEVEMNSVRMLRKKMLGDADEGKDYFVIGEDEDGTLAVSDIQGNKKFILLHEAAQYQDTGWIALRDFLDRSLTAKKQETETARMQREEEENISALYDAVKGRTTWDIGSPEQPMEVPIVEIREGADGGLLVKTTGENGEEGKFIPWNEVAAKLNMPASAKTDEELEEEQLDKRAQATELNKTVPDNADLQVPIFGEEGQYDTYKFIRADIDDGEVVIMALNPEGEEVTLAPEQISNLQGYVEAAAAEEAATEQNEPQIEDDAPVKAEEPAEKEQIFDDPIANELGISKDFLTVTKKGRRVVNSNALWAANPALLAQYNDKTNILGMNTVEYLTEKVDQVDKEISKQEALLKKEVLGANDEDRKEDIKDKITELTERRKEIAGVLQPYVDAMKAAEEAAAAEKAALEQEKAEAKAEKAANEDPALREPMTLEEAVANFISGLKKGSLNKEDFMRELGWSDEEAKRFFPYWAGTGKGMTLLKLAEQIGHEDTTGFVPQHGEADQADTQAIRDAVIDVLESSVSPKDVTDYTKRRNLDRRIEEENYAKGLADYEAQQKEVPVETGVFGPILRDYVGKPKEAVQKLIELQDGEAIGALSHPEIGSIDLVWGEEGTGHSDGYGLAKLVKYHPEVVENLQEILNDMKVISRSDNRVNLESERYKAAVRLTWDKIRKTWLLTVFEKKNSVLDNTTDTVETPNGSMQNDTATLQNAVSTNKDSNNSSISNTSKEKIEDMPDFGNEVQQEIAAAREEVNTEPTEAQKEAGNYKKGHIQLDGYDISIENPKGSVRKGTDASGKEWQQVMNNDYGYIRMTEGVDGDHIDVFLSDNPTEGNVFVVDQRNPQTGEFDEHKVMYGFNSAEEARAAYLANYEEGWQGLGAITEVTKDEFKKWVDNSHRKTKPFAEYKSVNAISGQKAAPVLEDMPEFSAQEKVFDFLGTTREKALMERLDGKLSEIDKRIAEHPEQTIELLREKAAAIQAFCEENITEANSKVIATAVDDLAGAMRKEGLSESYIANTLYQMSIARDRDIRPRSFRAYGGKIFMLADYLRDAKDVYTAFVHEEEHNVTFIKGDDQKLAAIADRDNLLDAIDGWVGYIDNYHNLSNAGVANEFISHAIERAKDLNDEEITKLLTDSGVTDEKIINFVKIRVNERRERIRKSVSDSIRRRRADSLRRGDAKDNTGANEGNSPERTKGRLDEQRHGIGRSGSSRAAGGRQTAEAESGTVGAGSETEEDSRRADEEVGFSQVPQKQNDESEDNFVLRSVVFLKNGRGYRPVAGKITYQEKGKNYSEYDEDTDTVKLRYGPFDQIEHDFFHENLHKFVRQQPNSKDILHQFADDWTSRFQSQAAMMDYIKAETNKDGSLTYPTIEEQEEEFFVRAIGLAMAFGEKKLFNNVPAFAKPIVEDYLKATNYDKAKEITRRRGDGANRMGNAGVAQKDQLQVRNLPEKESLPAAVRDLSPEERARVADRDLDGTGKMDVIEDVNGASEGNALFSFENGKSLVGLHNISAEKLVKALKLGGLANPSSAVIDLAFQNHFGYGDISLVMPSSLVDSKMGRNAGTFTGDAYTATFPTVKLFETKQSEKNLKEMLSVLPKELADYINRKTYDFVNGNVYHSGLEVLFLKEKGIETEILGREKSYPHASMDEFLTQYLKVPADVDFDYMSYDTLMDAYHALSEEERENVNYYVYSEGNKEDMAKHREWLEKYPKMRKRYTDDLGFGRLNQFIYVLDKDQRTAGEPDLRRTIEEAQRKVASNGYGDEFEIWLANVLDNLGYEAKIFSHWTYDGTKIWKKATLENISAKMRKDAMRNASEDVYTNATKALLLKKLRSLKDIRDNRGLLSVENEKEHIAASDAWSDVTSELSDMQVIDDNPFINRDIAARRLQEAILTKDPIAYLNKEYKYSLEKGGEFEQKLNEAIDLLKAIPSKYFETKFERPVYFNEFAAAVVPEDLADAIKKGLKDNGLKLYEYDSKDDNSRRDATIKASEEQKDVLFSFTAADSKPMEEAEPLQKLPAGKYPAPSELEKPEFSLAYHGSGADYDRFDISHALEGEGAMAHGYGHYVALNKDVAKGYAYAADGARRGREIRSAVQLQLDKAPSYYAKELLLATVQEMESGVPFEESKAKTLNMLKKAEEKRKAGRVGDYWKNISNAKEIEFFENLGNLDIPKWNHRRNLYTVDIPEDTGENYIHEKKELSKAQRAKIADALRKLPDDTWKFSDDDRLLFKEHTAASLANSLSKRLLNGYEIYAELNHGLGSMKAASEFLSDAGFVGIKYNGGIDGPCAVIFKDSDVRIEDHAMFSLSKNNRATVEKWLDKREDLSKDAKAAVIDFLNEMDNARLQLATARWFTAGVIRIPEDMYKVEQAVSVAEKAKVDPLQYDSPMALLEARAGFKPTEKRINPDEVSTLHKAKEFPEHGITVYDVDDSEESRQNMRQIINTHFGKEASPWCILQGDGNGNLTEQSARYWEDNNGYPKQVAFKDGKLLAFSANDSKERLWWDRQDSPHYDIPAGWRPIKGDALEREGQYVYSENGMLKPEENSFMKKGNRQNGEYTEWYPNGNLSEHGFYKNGKKEGTYEEYNKKWGYVYSRINYKNGEREGLAEEFYVNGEIRNRSIWEDGICTKAEQFYLGGKTKWVRNRNKNGELEEYQASYNFDGSLAESYEMKGGKKHGKHEVYGIDGKLRLEENYKNGELDGTVTAWGVNGDIKSRENYEKGHHVDVNEYYDYGDGRISLRMTYDRHGVCRRSEGFHKNGTIATYKLYDEKGDNHGVWKAWSSDGVLTYMVQFEHGDYVRNLFAEGVTEQEADVDISSFSFVSKEEQERLDKEPTVTMYRAMALVDGKLYPPMSSKEPNGPGEKGKRLQMRPASELGRWERADEAPEKAKEGKDGKYYFDLKKSNGESVDGVLYNPYFHTSVSPLNDQFTGASQRPELVTVEVEVPISELAGKYKAEKAADAVGAKDWHSGTVTAQMGGGRQVVLSRWVKPVRIVPDAEVAAIVAPKLKEKGIAVPANVVTPSLLAELQKQGVRTDADNLPMFSLVKEGNIDDISREFDSQLDLFKQNKQRGLFNLGRPSGILRSAGITVNQLSLSPVVLRKHINKHGFTTDDIKGLVYALQKPIMVYTHGKTHPNFIVITNMDYHNGQRITVSIEIAEDGSIVELNNISSIHTKSADFDINRLGEFSEEELKSMLRWVDKEKVSAWYNAGAPEGSSHIDEQKLSSVTKVINDFENPKDADYFFAIYSGDMKKAQQMVDEAAREAFPESAVGKAVLHGTKNQFRAFDPNKIGSNTDAGWLGRGFYFYGNNPTYASQYANFDNPKGGYIIRAYLDIQNPYWASVEDFHRLAEANNPKLSEEFTQRLKEEGYDGVYYNGDGNEEWVAFYPNQIKSADPVTYDEDGNVIPLSERFNPDNDDINFSLTSRQEDIAAAEKDGFKGIMDADERKDLRKAIYNIVPQSIREQIVDEALGNGMNIGKALDDYLQRLAEGGTQNDETGLLRELYNQIRDITGDEALTDEDCRYIVWNEGHGPVADDDIFGLISQRAHKKRFGAGEEAPMFSVRSEFGEATDEAREVAKEKVDEAKAELDETKKEAKQEAKQSALKAITLAMRGQKHYDKKTVDAVVKYAKEILRNGRIASLSRTEVNRLLGLVATSTGKAPAYVKRYVDQLTDTMLDIIVKDEEAKLEDLINIKDKTVNQQGVEAQGKLDLLGQETMKALRAYRTKSLEDIQARQSEISDQLSSANDALRKRAWAEKAGLDLAEQYVNTIGQSELEEYGLKKELNELKESKQAGAISKQAYKEFEADTKQAIRENKMDRVDSYRTMAAALSTEVKKSVKARAAFAEAEEARVDAIHHDANRDLYGQSAGIMNKESWLGKVVNKPVFRFFFQPLATFDQMMRMMAKHNVTGEGYLYNRFMRGWLKAREQYLTSLRDGNEKLDAKVSEVFGKEMKWVDLYSLDKKLPTMEVRMWDKEKMADIELTQGQLLYIYMVNKMTDGKMKLRKMGITEEKVEAIRNNLDPRFLELADWLQTDYLPERRNYYNAVHEKLFGAPMAAIEDYFPLKIAEGDRYEEVDVAKETPESALSSTVTAHIIKRTKNAKMLDILNANAFDVAMEHLESMEEWAAMAPFRKDLNTLLSYSHFRNQVKNMTTIYGSGNQLWKNFVNVSRIVAGTYNPVGKGTLLTNVSKSITFGKINFRLHTALKQMLSYPAFWTEARADDLAKGLANPLKSWDWCMENLPVFKHRWEKRTIGDTRLMESDSDWKVWKKNFVKKASRYGMTPNALIDAFTIAVGSKAVYDAKYRKYIAEGMAEAEADRRAKEDATIIYNQSQQSDEDAFVAAVQKDRTFEAAGITTFRNASMGYQRKVHNAYRTLGRLARGNKAAMIDSAARQYVATEGMEWEQAKARAEKEWKRAGAKAAGDIFIYQFLLNYLWKIGPLGLVYILMGDDDDKRKKKLLDPLVTTAITGFFEGLSTGGTTTDVIGGLVSGDNYKQWTFLGNPILQDIQNLGNTIKNKGEDTQSAFEIVSLLAQGWCGVDPHLLSDTYAAVVDAAEGDMGIAKEIAFLLMRIAQMPQSVMKDFYIDEIQMTAKEAGKAKAKELAERYVEYKKMRRDPLGEILPKSKEEEEKEKKSDKAATTKLMNEAFPKKQK